MSRIAKKPVNVPKNVEIEIDGQKISVKGEKGATVLEIHHSVSVEQGDAEINVRTIGDNAQAMAGTMRSLICNAITGVSKGFEKKLQLVGVGYRAQVQGDKLNLVLGHSHPIAYPMPEGITIETPSQTEVVVKGIDRQKVGQVSAEIRAFRPPEPYKGKGVKYLDELIVRKEAKKK